MVIMANGKSCGDPKARGSNVSSFTSQNLPHANLMNSQSDLLLGKPVFLFGNKIFLCHGTAQLQVLEDWLPSPTHAHSPCNDPQHLICGGHKGNKLFKAKGVLTSGAQARTCLHYFVHKRCQLIQTF